MIKVFYCGDEVTLITTYVKGMSSWTDGVVHSEAGHLRDALTSDPDIDLTYVPTHRVQREFPMPDEILQYDVVIFSDVGTDTVIMYEDRFLHCPMGKDRLGGMKKFVEKGGGLAGVGGWVSFGGMFGMAKWHNTVVEEILPVTCFPYDDRVELSEGMTPEIIVEDHPFFEGVDFKNAPVLFSGYNQVVLKEDATLLAKYKDDPIIATGQFGKGRTMILASDPAPHWGRGMVEWDGYTKFWLNVVKWLAKEK